MTKPILSETVLLREHATVHNVSLTSHQARAISAFKISSDGYRSDSASDHRPHVISVSPGSSSGLYTLSAGSVIGSVSIAGKQINILPKVGVGRTGQMLAYSLGLSRFQKEASLFADSTSLALLLAPAFLAQAETVIRQGLVEDYVRCAETGSRPRGRIYFRTAMSRGLPSPIDYEFDDLTGDTQPNRLLLRALHAIGDMQRLPNSLHAKARSLLGAFEGVNFVESPIGYHGSPLPERLSHYREALILGTLVLDGFGIEPIPSSRLSRGLLFDMNRVVEEFLTSLIRQSVPEGLTVDVQGKDHPRYLDRHKQLRLKPDFSIWDRKQCHVVGDIKYKVLDSKNGARRPDLYQMISYAAATGARRAVLLYVGQHPGFDVHAVAPDVTIEVRAVDIEQDIGSVRQQMQALIGPASSGRA